MATSSKEQQTMSTSTEERRVRTSIVPATATFVPISLPQPGLHSSHTQLQRLDEEMRRMREEMGRLWQQTALDRESQLQGLRQQMAVMQGQGQSQGTVLPRMAHSDIGALQPLQGNVSLTPESWPAAASMEDAQWGPLAHPGNWRLKEDFHIDNPVVLDPQGKRIFRLEFDLRMYKPEEIQVTLNNRVLTVQAKHEAMTEGKQVKREYYRQYLLPGDVRDQDVTSQLSSSGILVVSAPVVQALPSSDEAGARPLNIVPV